MSKFVILHKKKDTLNRLCCIMKVTKQTLQHLRKKVPLANTIHHSTFIYNQLKKLNLCKSFSVLLFTPRGILPVNSNVWIAIFMQLFLAALDKIIFRDYNYNSVIYHCYNRACGMICQGETATSVQKPTGKLRPAFGEGIIRLPDGPS